jgi:hypothetical protein
MVDSGNFMGIFSICLLGIYWNFKEFNFPDLFQIRVVKPINHSKFHHANLKTFKNEMSAQISH